MREPGEPHPGLRQAAVWPLSAVETGLMITFGYLVLLIALVAARQSWADPPTEQAVGAPVDAFHPLVAGVPAGQARATCVGPDTEPHAYAEEPAARTERAFGPPVEPADGQVYEVSGELLRRLCGGIPAPGRPAVGPDRRLWLALDAAVNGGDPNRTVTRGEWAAGVTRFVQQDAQWTRARLVTRGTPRGTATYAMVPRTGADPLVDRTRYLAAHTSRYLDLPVRSRTGTVVTLRLRLPCGFQPNL